MIIESSFKAAWWLPSAHSQTIFPTLTRRLKTPIDRVERIELPDGDFVDLAWGCNGLSNNAPLVVCLHGLGGNANSSYIAGFFHTFNQCGWRAVLMHFRGASDEPNRLARAYHSGDTNDLDYVLRYLAKREPNTKKAVVGVSLGGNVLLKWLGEHGSQSLIQTGVAVSVPFQLRAAADRMNRGFSKIYQSHLLGRLCDVFNRKRNAYREMFPDTFADIHQLRCFWTFDEHVTAPLHGFANVHDYYREASSRQYIPDIATPTLIIHSLDDPFMTPEILPTEAELPKEVTLELSQRGGHVGFISGNVPGMAIYWLDQRLPIHLKLFLS